MVLDDFQQIDVDAVSGVRWVADRLGEPNVQVGVRIQPAALVATSTAGAIGESPARLLD
jgi:hypothetical protein